MASILQLRVLGPLEASWATPDGATAIDLGGPRQRAVVALLLVARGDVVSVDRLIDDLWHGEPPAKAMGGLQVYISNLRRALEPDRQPRSAATVLVSKAPGYALSLPPDAVDAWRFETLLRDAGRQPDAGSSRRVLEEALDLWRGPAYAEFGTDRWAVPEAARLDGMRTVARERLAAAMVASGAPTDAVLLAEALTREEPTREEGWRLLATAQYLSGRQGEALSTLRRARSVFAEELGLDPGPALTALEADVLAHRVRPPAPTRPRDAPAGPAPPAEVGTPTEPATRSRRRPDDGFVGREEELNELHRLAQHAAQRRHPPEAVAVALVTGDPGDGKSALLRRFLTELGRSGWRVAVGRCPEVDGAPPAWGWTEVLTGLARQVDPGPHQRALTPLLNDTADVSSPAGTDSSYERFQLGRAVAGYLAQAAADRPLVVALDDLHRADVQTLDLLATVAGQPAPARLLVIASYRPGEVGAALQDFLARIAGLAPTRLRLGGLDVAQAARLVRSVAGVQPDESTVAALTERTGGNPFYLAESARLLGSEGSLVALSAVPEGVRDVLRRRFARLPDSTLAVLQVASVIGRYVDVDLLVRAMSHQDRYHEEAVVDAVDSGLVAGLLEEPAPGVLRFSHALVRDTLYGDVPALRRRRWHSWVGAALEELHPGDVAALAHHFGHAGASGARQALDYHEAAAVAASARFAHDVVADHYRQALVALDSLGTAADDPGIERRVGLLVALFRAQVAGGAAVAAAATRATALDLATRADRGDLVIDVLTALDVPTPWLNRPYGVVDGVVVEHLERALATPGLDAERRIRLLCALIGEIGGEPEQHEKRTLEAALEAERLARRMGSPALLGLALHAQYAVALPDSDPALRLAHAQELVDIGQQDGLEVYALLGHNNAFQVHAVRLDLDLARAQLDRVGEYARRYNWGQATGQVTIGRAMLEHVAGDLETAERLYLEGGQALAAAGQVNPQSTLALALFTVRLDQGRLPELESAIRELPSDVDPRTIEDFLALILLQQDRLDEARAARVSRAEIRRDFLRCLFLTIRGMVVAALGERDEAAGVYESLLPYHGQLAGIGNGAFVLGPVDQILGELASLAGEPARATAHFRVAHEVAGRCGNALWAQAAASRL